MALALAGPIAAQESPSSPSSDPAGQQSPLPQDSARPETSPASPEAPSTSPDDADTLEASVNDPRDVAPPTTNPVNLNQFVQIYSTYEKDPDGGYNLANKLRAAVTFAERRAQLRLTAPFLVSAENGMGVDAR